MADADGAGRIALGLPGVTGDWIAYRVDGKLFAWAYPERIHPKRGRVPNRDVLSVRVPNLEEKDAMLLMEPDRFFTTDHYHGYPSVLVRLAEVDEEELRELIVNAWRTKASRKRLAELEQGA